MLADICWVLTSSLMQCAACASSQILTAVLPGGLYYFYFVLVPLFWSWRSERSVEWATHCHTAEPDVNLKSDSSASFFPRTPNCSLIIVKILKDTNEILIYSSPFLSSSKYSPVWNYRERWRSFLLLVPCVDTVLFHQLILPEECHSTINIKTHKRLLRILWKCWWLDPIWYSLLKAAWDIISSAYTGMIAFCRIAHYVNTLILLFFWLATLPCEAVHIVLFLRRESSEITFRGY